VTVASTEYRGRAFFGMARSKDGSELYFRADDALPRGSSATLQPVTGRALVFRGAPA
jgi:putative spermidine/putrescine transport system ATP-binding protein